MSCGVNIPGTGIPITFGFWVQPFLVMTLSYTLTLWFGSIQGTLVVVLGKYLPFGYVDPEGQRIISKVVLLTESPVVQTM